MYAFISFIAFTLDYFSTQLFIRFNILMHTFACTYVHSLYRMYKHRLFASLEVLSHFIAQYLCFLFCCFYLYLILGHRLICVIAESQRLLGIAGDFLLAITRLEVYSDFVIRVYPQLMAVPHFPEQLWPSQLNEILIFCYKFVYINIHMYICRYL